MMRRLGSVTSWLSLLLAALVILAWGISYVRVDGIALRRSRELPMRPAREAFLPAENASSQERAAAALAQDRAMLAVLLEEVTTINENMRYTTSPAAQRNGRIALLSHGPLNAWPTNPPDLRLIHERKERGGQISLDDVPARWWYAGFGYRSWMSLSFAAHVLVVPHWFLASLFAAWPGWRWWCGWKERRRAGFEVVMPALPRV